MELLIRTYRSSDAPALARLFYETVHSVNLQDYTLEQAGAWAPRQIDLTAWDRSLARHFTVVALEDSRTIGFGDMAPDGYLDRLYVARTHLRRGVASALCDALPGARVTRASLTARPFFLARGYRVVEKLQVERRGVLLASLLMEKQS